MAKKKASSNRARPKRRRAPTKPKARSVGRRRKKKSGGVGAQLRSWLTRFLIKTVGVSFIVGLCVATWMYQTAVERVESVLERPIWSENGKITGQLVVRRGLRTTIEHLSVALGSAGYSQVSTPLVAGDFSVSDNRLFVKEQDVDVLVTFRGNRIESVSPFAVHRFSDTELAGIGFTSERRQPIRLSDMPEHLVMAVLAMEDARFYEHGGIDAWGIGRALVANVFSRGHKQGGSTLTQQLAKNLFLTPERSLKRKVKELALAVALENRLTKDQILELYLNQVYLGSVGGMGIGGVDQAAKTYFGTSAKRLDVGQSATLAGIISAPNRYSPSRHPERARERRNLTLKRMVDLGWLPPGVRAEWVDRELRVRPHKGFKKAPWATDEAVRVVEQALGDGIVADGMVTIQTSIDALLQQLTNEAIRETLADLARQYPKAQNAQAAAIAMDPASGAILAMVGGRSYTGGGFNRATVATRQVGSIVKPLTWLALFEADPEQSPTSWVPDDPIERPVNGDVWSPQNYDGAFKGEVTLQDALSQSRNIPAVHVSEWVGLGPLADHLQNIGFTGARAYPSIALGAFEGSLLDAASAYSVFPGFGTVVAPSLVQSVRLPDGREGWSTQNNLRRVASPRSVYLLNTMLQETMQTGTGKGSRRWGVQGTMGGKTGTTDGGRDAWFVGFTPSLVVAVWVGHDKGAGLGLTGAQAALPIWSKIVAGSGHMTDEPWPVPSDVVRVSLCAESTEVAVEECPEVKDGWFSKESEDGTPCTLHSGERFSETTSIIDRIRSRFRPERVDDAEDTAAPPKKKKRGFWKRRRRGD